MKKTLLIFSIGLSGLICAQTAPNQSSKINRAAMLSPQAPSPNEGTGQRNAGAGKAAKTVKHATKRHDVSTVTKYYIGCSYNILGVITAACQQVDANQDLGMISFTHRESAALEFSSGAYETDYSITNGSTWDTAKAMNFKSDSGNTSGPRYPNGVILNPVGNTTASSAFAITSGPHTNSTSWDSIVFGSIRFDSMYTVNHEVLMYPNVNTQVFYVFSAPHYMSVSNDSVVHSIGNCWTYNSGLTADQGWYGAMINKGVWNGATHTVTWTDTILRPHLASSAGSSAPFDSLAEVTQVSMAWSQDGSVGYVVFWGNLDSTGYNYASMQPIVYKSTNHGSTWAMMPMTNFASVPNLVRFLKPAIDSAITLPFWDINGDSSFYAGHDVDMTVDANYNLHIFGVIESGAIANPDSGGYTYNPSVAPSRYVYDVFTTTSSGGWQADLLDSLISPEGIDASNTLWTSTADGSFVWGARVQASRTTDGTKVFCTWLDDYSAEGEIISPDITTIGVDVTTNMKTPPTRVTTDGINYFLQVGDIALVDGSCYNVPCVVVNDPAAPDEGLTPVEYMYVQGATLCDSSFTVPTAINTVASSKTGFSISPNYPNPFNNITNFNVNLTQESEVTVEVYNLLGEKIYTIPTQKMSNGTHIMTINGNNWKSGVYFYKVIVDGQALTQKMVVQK
jgi:hypothetical protein